MLNKQNNTYYPETIALEEKLTIELNEQQDPNEFCKLFLEKIEHEAKSISRLDPKVSPITDLISGLECTSNTCDTCSFKSKNDSSFKELGLQLQGTSSVEEALEKYCKEEAMDGENKYACSKCISNGLGNQTAKRRVEISVTPPVLFVQLNRNLYVKGKRTKLRVRVG